MREGSRSKRSVAPPCAARASVSMTCSKRLTHEVVAVRVQVYWLRASLEPQPRGSSAVARAKGVSRAPPRSQLPTASEMVPNIRHEKKNNSRQLLQTRLLLGRR